MVRVGVVGAGGKVGREVCRAVSSDPELELVAAVDPRLAGIDLRQVTGSDGAGLQVGSGVEELGRAEVEVAVDFTVADVALETMRWCAANAVHAVVGTTGIPRSSVGELESLFEQSKANCLIAANFAIGAVLMMRFAEMAAPFMDGAEIIELHHDGKLDAPSGTALMSAERLESARRRAGCGPWAADRTTSRVLDGTRGGEGPGGVRIHSVRLPGLVAHQEVILGTVGQSLTLRHDAYDRTSFMPGVLLAVKAVARLPGLTIGLDRLLGF
ncbi:MAG TPA: 4-hydroxy-tetrahydrodipicolinate reductase [Acidimicrobiales bacterium]|nr:4-hydroxy-tetrahydrodipicolinate reductase [Acidimicrobiales bacterium]